MTKKNIVIAILALISLVFFISAIWHMNHSRKYKTEPRDLNVISVSKDDYEIREDGTVLIYCTYTIQNSWRSPLSISIGGIFWKEKACDFLEENVLFADGVYTVEADTTTTVHVVFVGHNGDSELMPDRNPPEPFIIYCDDVEDTIDEG